MKSWIQSWTVPQAIVAGISLVCATALAIVITLEDDWGKLVRWLSSPEAAAFLTALVTLALTLYTRARKLPPPTETPPASPPRSPEGGYALLEVMLAVCFVCAAALLLHGCGQTTPVAQQAAAVEVAATFTSGVAQGVSDGAAYDASHTCPVGSDPSCVDAVLARWAPVDAAIASARSALQLWLTADRIAAAANEDPIATCLDEIGHFARALLDALHAARRLGAHVPDVPPILCALPGVPADLCSSSSGGES